MRAQLLMGYSHLSEWPHNHTHIGYTNRTQELPPVTKRAEEMIWEGGGVKSQSWKEEVRDGRKQIAL